MTYGEVLYNLLILKPILLMIANYIINNMNDNLVDVFRSHTIFRIIIESSVVEGMDTGRVVNVSHMNLVSSST